jgi:hypothetical protein
MITETKDSALAFVGQIMTAYRAAMKVEGDALLAAIECGKYLNLAKENVKANASIAAFASQWRDECALRSLRYNTNTQSWERLPPQA